MTEQPEGPIDLAFLAQQSQRVLAELAKSRDDAKVITAMMTRLDGTLRSTLDEMRQISRLPKVRKWPSIISSHELSAVWQC
jgi:hypothetical protein